MLRDASSILNGLGLNLRSQDHGTFVQRVNTVMALDHTYARFVTQITDLESLA